MKNIFLAGYMYSISIFMTQHSDLALAKAYKK
jgi:hypothetical protein